MDPDELEEKLKIAKEIVMNENEPFKTEGFKIILNHLLQIENNAKKNKKTRKRISSSQTSKSSSSSKPSFDLIPLDLSKKSDKPSLKEFFEEKKPSSNQEIITLFCYYLTKYLNISNMQYGHALFCYNEIKKPKPTNIEQLFRDTIRLKKWVESGDEAYTIKLSIAGENLIEHELPSNKPEKRSDQ